MPVPSPIPSPVDHPNAYASGTAGALAVLVIYVLQQAGVEVPQGVQVAAVTIAGYVALLLAGRKSTAVKYLPESQKPK